MQHDQETGIGIVKDVDTTKRPETEAAMAYQTGLRMDRMTEHEQDNTKG